MLAGILCVLALGGALVVLRSRASAPARTTEPPIPRALGAIAVLLAVALPLFQLAPLMRTFHGDDMTHARIGADIARHGLPHGWIDSYLGGFPFGHHYPPVTWLALAALVRMGLAPVTASSVLGVLATVATPLAVYFGAVRLGVRVAAAAAGALLVAWVSPYNPFVGGYEVFFHVGLLSQALGTPPCVVLACTLVRSRSPWAPVVAAVVAIATHPQLAVATIVVTSVATLVAADRGAFERLARATTAAAFTGLALYAKGLSTLRIPFGWPPNASWRQLGFPPERLAWWILDGDLLDRGRTPVLTAIAAAALLVSLLLARRPLARAAIAALAIALVGSVSGHALEDAGPPWSSLLAFLQPLRVVALTPLAAAALVIVALDEGTARWEVARPRALAWVRPGELVVVLMCLLALPARLAAAKKDAADLAVSASAPCGPLTPRGYSRERVHAWLRELAPDRLAYWPTDGSGLLACALDDDLELAVPGPIAVTGGAGSHVGVHWLAFRQIHPARPGSARRAEALGVRYLLRTSEDAVPEGWRSLHHEGAVSLLENEAKTRLVGAGCMRERWQGSDAALRRELYDRLPTAAGAERLLSPTELVALAITPRGELAIERADDGACDASGARVAETRTEPGRLEAVVTSASPVDVVLRVAAFPSWTVEIDGARASTTLVSPGFPSVRVPAGEHRVRAVASHDPSWPLVLLAVLAVAAAGGLRRRHLPTFGRAAPRRG